LVAIEKSSRVEIRAAVAPIQYLSCGNNIRLTAPEVERLSQVTGVRPQGIKSMDGLRAFLERCRDAHCGESIEKAFLRLLIEREILKLP
jgi:hypothetical protein